MSSERRTPTRQRRRDESAKRNEEVDDFELFKQQAYCSSAAFGKARPVEPERPEASGSPNSGPVGAYRKHHEHGQHERGRIGSLRNDTAFSHSIDAGSVMPSRPNDEKEFGGRRAYSVKTNSSGAMHGLKPAGSRFAHDEHKSPLKLSPHSSGSSLVVPQDGVHRSASRECVRNFESTPKGVINKGDSFRSDGSSPRGSSPTLNGDQPPTDEAPMPAKASQILGCAPAVFYVQMLGAAAVGKSSLCQQFLTSEYMGNIDPDDLNSNMPEPDLNVACDCQKHVCVKLDGKESIVIFIDTACNDGQDQELFGCVDAYVLVFAMDDRESYDYASALLTDLVGERHSDIPFILVSNKSDLVRRCEVDANEGRELASRFGCHFMETSASLNHHVDDLLVTLLKIVRTARHAAKKAKKHESTKKVAGFLKRLSIRSRPKK